MAMDSQPLAVQVCEPHPPIQRFVIRQALFLRERSCRVRFVVGNGNLATRLRRLGFEAAVVPIGTRLSPIRDLRAIRSLTTLFRQWRPDIVHTHDHRAGLIGRGAARLSRVSRVVHTMYRIPFGQNTPTLMRLPFVVAERLVGAMSHTILCTSGEDIRLALRAEIYSRRGMVEYLGTGVDVRRFDPARVERRRLERLRRQLGLSPELPVILVAGRLGADNGYFGLLAALRRLRDTPWNLVCQGESPETTATLRQWVLQHGLRDRVHTVETCPDLAALLGLATLFVLPCRRGHPTTRLIEAQAMGLAAVVTDVRGLREVVVDGQTGLVVPPRDEQALARAIGALLNDAALRHRMGIMAARRTRRLFGRERVFQRLWQVYERLLTTSEPDL